MVRAMKKKMKIIDLLNKIANGEEAPKKIKVNKIIFEYQGDDYLYKDEDKKEYWLFSAGYTDKFEWLESALNNEVEILDDEEDKDIPLIPDDELWNIEHINLCGVDRNNAIDYNFKVLKEKINQIAEELNRRNNEKESSNKD